jgi:EAL and modified HD-GYP domain-containing signal transduction protein
MDRFLARQPILSSQKQIFGYEILSRFGPENYCRIQAGELMNTSAMDELFLFGLRQMTNGLPAFLNCTRDFLLRDYLDLLPRETVIGEILESVRPDASVLAACRRVKQKGYRLALDDYEDSLEMEPLFEVADFVKVDFLTTSLTEQARLGEKFRRLGIALIAEKVETLEQFHRGLEMGYELFQGYFFCRPQMLGRRNMSANTAIYLQLIEAASGPELNFHKIADLVKKEVSLSYRLLRYLNSPAFPFSVEVRSIPHALTLLGERAAQKWLSLVCVAVIGEGKPGELVKIPLIRARFCELLAEAAENRTWANDLFLLGLLSVMDALLDMPMADVLAVLPVSREIKDTLRGRPTPFRPFFEVALDYESGTWDQLAASSNAIQLHENLIPDLYLQAVAWVDQIFYEVPLIGAR